jgi:predicted flavoprotein YhiN
MKTVHIVGGGVSGIFLALNLIRKNIHVKLYEGTSSLGKKFLVAGKSDLNITHSEDHMASKYFENKDLFKSLLGDFSNKEFIAWLEDCGFET